VNTSWSSPVPSWSRFGTGCSCWNAPSRTPRSIWPSPRLAGRRSSDASSTTCWRPLGSACSRSGGPGGGRSGRRKSSKSGIREARLPWTLANADTRANPRTFVTLVGVPEALNRSPYRGGRFSASSPPSAFVGLVLGILGLLAGGVGGLGRPVLAGRIRRIVGWTRFLVVDVHTVTLGPAEAWVRANPRRDDSSEESPRHDAGRVGSPGPPIMPVMST
jgi:hypothetical protein